MQQPRRVFHLFPLASFFVLLLATACSSPSSLTSAPPPPLHAAAELISPFVSPLPSGEKPPIGVAGLPGERSVEPTWPFVAPDGRQLKLSQVEAEEVARNFFRSRQATDNPHPFIRLTYARLPSLGRDVLFVNNDPDYPHLNHAVPIDLNSGERMLDEWLQAGDLTSSWYAYPHGKLDEPLVAALERAQPDTSLRVGVHAYPVDTKLVDVELVRLFPELLPTWLESGELGNYGVLARSNPDFVRDVDAVRWRIYAARQAAAREPIVAWLQGEGAPAYSFNGEIIWTELTPDQILRLVHEDAVNLISYQGPPDPNALQPTPTPTALPDPWRRVPFTTLAQGTDGPVHSWTPATPNVWLVRNADDVGGPAPLPDSAWLRIRQLSFYDEAALVVHMGVEGSGCYDVRVTDLATDGALLRVYADFFGPAPGQACTAAMTAPYHVVSVPAGYVPSRRYPTDPIELISQERTGGPWPP